MWKTLKTLVIGLCLFMAFSHGPASSQTTKTPLNNASWTDLGAGPLFLSTIGGSWYAVSSTTPSLVQEGFPVPPGGVPVNSTEHVWARLDTDFIGNAYTYTLVAGTLTFSWPGNCGNGVIAAAATPGCVVPYINSYIIGGSSSVFTVPHASSIGTVAALAAKGSSGFLLGFNCTGISGGAAGFCVGYNSATTPSAGALTATAVLDFCFFDTTTRGCSLGRAPSQVAYSAGIQILVTTATSPYTYTTGASAAVSADFQ